MTREEAILQILRNAEGIDCKTGPGADDLTILGRDLMILRALELVRMVQDMVERTPEGQKGHGIAFYLDAASRNLMNATGITEKMLRDLEEAC